MGGVRGFWLGILAASLVTPHTWWGAVAAAGLALLCGFRAYRNHRGQPV